MPQPADLECWHYLQADLQRLVSDAAYAADTLSAITSLTGSDGLAVLVNNAAVQVLGGMASLSVADWHRTLDVNLLAPFVLTQGLLPNLQAADGCVINISSIHARLTKANFVAYATSKAALSGMTRAIVTNMLKAGFAHARPIGQRLALGRTAFAVVGRGYLWQTVVVLGHQPMMPVGGSLPEVDWDTIVSDGEFLNHEKSIKYLRHRAGWVLSGGTAA